MFPKSLQPKYCAACLLVAASACGSNDNEHAKAKVADEGSNSHEEAETAQGLDGGEPSSDQGIATSPIPPPHKKLCNGRNEITFAAAKVEGGQFDSAQIAAIDGWGLHYHWLVVIDGQCNFWIKPSNVVGVRTGTLDADQTDVLETELRLGTWDSLENPHMGGVADQGALSLFDGWGSYISCPFTGCNNTEVNQVVQYSAGLPTLLGGEGSTWVQAARLSVREATPAEGVQPDPLPETLNTQLLMGYSNAPEAFEGYRALELSDPTSLEWLRERRTHFIEGGHWGNPTLDMPVSTWNGATWGIMFREKIPYEDDRGFLPF